VPKQKVEAEDVLGHRDVPTTIQSHQVGYDQTNHVVYTLGGGLVSFTTPF